MAETRKNDGKSRTFRFFPREWDLITRVAAKMGITRTNAVVAVFEEKEARLNEDG